MENLNFINRDFENMNPAKGRRRAWQHIRISAGKINHHPIINLN
ncbi:hypothetical protein [Christiangramia oceanisediminis]|nr:hypothetical protein [Gramella oceanisediminis]